MEWYYTNGGQQLGPMPFRQMADELRRLPDWRQEFVWREGLDNWIKASEVPELKAAPPPLPNPAPSPQIPTLAKRVSTKAIAIGSFTFVLIAAAIGGSIGRGGVDYLMQPSPERRTQKLHEAQSLSAARVKATLPKKVDEATTLVDISAQDARLTYFYEVDDVNYSIGPDFASIVRKNVTDSVCKSTVVNTMRLGARYIYTYHDTKKRSLTSFETRLEDCQ